MKSIKKKSKIFNANTPMVNVSSLGDGEEKKKTKFESKNKSHGGIKKKNL